MRRLPLLTILCALGCGSENPFCGPPLDATGRLVAYCENPREEPVCNEPGMEARFEEGPVGVVLVGGRRATCSAEDEIMCPPETTGEPFCLLDPEL